jgi:tetratricopeptide (TPR) repeat protein
MRRSSHTLLRVVFWAGIVLLLLAIARAVTGAQPALPTLEFDRFPAEARQSIETAYRDASTQSKDATATGRLGMVLQSWEQWTAALTAYQRAQTLAPQMFDWWYLAGVVEARLGRPADAAKSFDRGSKLSPAYVPARLKLAEALFDAGNLAASAKVYESLANDASADSDAAATKSSEASAAKPRDAAAAKGKTAATAAASAKAKTQAPTSNAASETASATAGAADAALPGVRYGLGRIKAAQGDTAGAAAQFEEACRLFPEFGAAHYALALAYRRLGRSDEAQREISLHQRYTNAWPGVDDPIGARIAPLRVDARAHMERGIAAWKAGSLDDAIKEHEEAVRLQPSLAQAHANLIILYGRQGSDPASAAAKQAEAHYRTVVALNSNLGEAHYNHGVLLMEQHRPDEAIDTFKRALLVNPHNAAAHANLGLLLEQRRDFAAAEQEYRLAVEDDPSSRANRFSLGRVLIALGRLDDAIAAFEKLQTQPPEDADTPRYRYALAAAHLRAGHREQGLSLAREARALAERYGQTSLIASIDRDLASIGIATGNH